MITAPRWGPIIVFSQTGLSLYSIFAIADRLPTDKRLFNNPRGPENISHPSGVTIGKINASAWVNEATPLEIYIYFVLISLLFCGIWYFIGLSWNKYESTQDIIYLIPFPFLISVIGYLISLSFAFELVSQISYCPSYKEFECVDGLLLPVLYQKIHWLFWGVAIGQAVYIGLTIEVLSRDLVPSLPEESLKFHLSNWKYYARIFTTTSIAIIIGFLFTFLQEGTILGLRAILEINAPIALSALSVLLYVTEKSTLIEKELV